MGSSDMSRYRYSPLSPGRDSIRLLRLMPNKNKSSAEIQCKLIEYSLQDQHTGIHLYHALSYTWGGMNKPHSISINNQNLAITENLHAALLRLRDRFFEQMLWVDAVCINQENLEERDLQVQLMAKIYSKATRVIIWLGETADNSNIALETLRLAAENESLESLNSNETRQAILALLQRPWFRRIWVSEQALKSVHNHN
jgi:hypothetical protein